jgi:hypothetical protein
MKIIKPIPINNAMITSSNVLKDDFKIWSGSPEPISGGRKIKYSNDGTKLALVRDVSDGGSGLILYDTSLWTRIQIPFVSSSCIDVCFSDDDSFVFVLTDKAPFYYVINIQLNKIIDDFQPMVSQGTSCVFGGGDLFYVGTLNSGIYTINKNTKNIETFLSKIKLTPAGTGNTSGLDKIARNQLGNAKLNK